MNHLIRSFCFIALLEIMTQYAAHKVFYSMYTGRNNFGSSDRLYTKRRMAGLDHATVSLRTGIDNR